MDRVLLLMDQKENRRLLADWLAARYTVLAREATVDEQYDLGILDGTALDRLADRIHARKKREGPVFLPFLLVTPRQAVGLVTGHLWKSIDEITHTPLDKVELQARIEVLLRVRRQSADLHDATRQRLAELVNELAEADRRKDEFLALLGHELRNPLAPILNGLHILKTPGVNDATIEHTRQMMERQVKYLVRLVDDLLDISRITRGKITLVKKPVDLANVFTQAIEMARPALDAQEHELAISLPPVPLRLEGDVLRLAQVIANLLNNAAKYTQRAGQIWLAGEREGNQVVVRVRDTGMGIAEELLPHIFDLFVQADRSLERSQGGLGIGLTLVHKLVEMHGGTVAVHSDGPGKGSEFVVRLPALLQTPPPETRQGEEHPSVAAVSRRVLVVDDNVAAADMLAALLRLWGHEVRLAYNGPEALAAAAEYRPDLVLLDIGLPLMSGYEVARRLRGQLRLDQTTLVAVTGYGQEEDRRRSQEAGFDRHLTKPVDADSLQALLASPTSAVQAAEYRGKSRPIARQPRSPLARGY
jgi:signal transduction histidine kinase/FixJ family two-component response regulator